jgi:PKD repeat protein
MKKILLLIGIALVSLNLHSQTGWQVLNSGFSNSLNDILVIDDSIVACVGGTATAGQAVYSYNAGNSFASQNISPAMLNAMAVTPNGLWVVGNQGKIYHTLNGILWNTQSSGTTTDLRDIQFPSASTGYIVGGSGIVLKTVNASTWTNPIISGGTTYTLNAVHFTTDLNGVVGGDYNFIQGFLSYTTSGGTYFGFPITTISKINDIFFLNSTTGFAVAEGGNLYKSTNSGSSWLIQSSGTTTNLNAVHFYNSNFGYIVGDNGLILHTTNGGLTWTPQNSGVNHHLNGVFCVDSNICYAVGDSGTIIRTTTAGAYLSLNVADDTAFCSGYTNLIASTAYSGQANLTYTWASSPLLSSTTDSVVSVGPIQSTQTFYVTVTDGTLSASDSATVFVQSLPPDSICLVTVDDSLGHNVVVFEKHVLGAIQYYKIYGESSVSGVYDSLGFIPYDSVGIFVDTLSNPAVKAYSYKISLVDSCGNESLLSDFHKTMHLTINQGTGSTWNLIWNNYIGVPVQTYRIWRFDASNTWSKIDSVPGNNTSYSDLNPPSGCLYYQVEIISPYICQPFNYKANTNYNTSRSNTAHNGVSPSPLTADFSVNTSTGSAPLQVQFINQSMGITTSYLWRFGDGDTSNQMNPAHTYTTQGLYTVTLVIQNTNEIDSIVKVDFIDVQPNAIQQQTIQKRIHLYPNPANENQKVIIKHPGIQIHSAKLINIVGTALSCEISFFSDFSELNLNTLTKGVYFILLTDEQGLTYQTRLVIK